MLASQAKKHFILLLLSGLLLVRIGGVHSMVHLLSDHGLEHCEQCEMILHSTKATPLHGSSSESCSTPELFDDYAAKEHEVLYSAPFQKTLLSDYFHNKPPPSPFIG